MTELSARLALYAAIDQAALRDPDVLKRVADVLPVYRYDVAGATAGPADAPRHDERQRSMDVRRENTGDGEAAPQGAAGWSDEISDFDRIELPDLDTAFNQLADNKQPNELEQAKRLRAA